MASPGLAHFKIHSEGDISVVEFVVRALDEASKVQEVGKQLYELVDRWGHKNMVLDFANVQFLTSSALGILVTLQQKIDYQKGRLALCNLRSQLLQVFKFAQLDKVLVFYETCDDALASFNAQRQSG